MADRLKFLFYLMSNKLNAKSQDLKSILDKFTKETLTTPINFLINNYPFKIIPIFKLLSSFNILIKPHVLSKSNP